MCTSCMSTPPPQHLPIPPPAFKFLEITLSLILLTLLSPNSKIVSSNIRFDSFLKEA